MAQPTEVASRTADVVSLVFRLYHVVDILAVIVTYHSLYKRMVGLGFEFGSYLVARFACPIKCSVSISKKAIPVRLL